MARQGIWAVAFLVACALPAHAQETLFFSEYVEGTGTNKALEIYNPLDTAVLLTGAYSVQIFANGAVSPTTTISLTGTVAAGDVFVLANSAANATILAAADQLSGGLTFSGNDAIVLRANGVTFDVFGKVGEDPGVSGWGGLTTDHTLRRSASICLGDTVASDAFDPATQWTAFANDTVDGIGAHTANCNFPPPAAPTGLLASPLNARVHLRWNFATDAYSHSIKRSLSSGGPYSTIASGVTSPPYIDTTVANGTTYYYVITPRNLDGEDGTDSAEVVAMPDTESRMVISEVYGGSGPEPDDYNADYIELFNRSKIPMGVLGWSVQHAFATESSWEVTFLSDLIVPPGKFLFIREFKPNTVGGKPTPAFDAVGLIDLGNLGKVALSTTSATLTGSDPHLNIEIADFVGYGATNAAEGTPAPTAGGDTEAITRTSPCIDTNDNGADFQATAPNPQNSASAAVICNQPPAISLSLSSPQSVAESSPITFTVTGSDADGDSLTFSFSGLSTTPDVPTLTGSGNARTFSWTPNLSRAPGPYVVTFTVSDATASAQASMTIDVTNRLQPPGNVGAVATTPTNVMVTWTASQGATRYDIYRVSSTGGVIAGDTTETFFLDTDASPETAYFYSVFAVDSSGASAPSAGSAADLATTVIYEDEPLASGATAIRGRHVEQLRIAANAVRALAGLDEYAFDNPMLAGVPIRKVHLDQIRLAVDAALDDLSLPPRTYTDATITANVTAIRGIHLAEIRAALR